MKLEENSIKLKFQLFINHHYVTIFKNVFVWLFDNFPVSSLNTKLQHDACLLTGA